MKLEISWQIFEKYSDIKFLISLPVGAELFHMDRWTNIETDMFGANGRFSKFWEGTTYDTSVDSLCLSSRGVGRQWYKYIHPQYLPAIVVQWYKEIKSSTPKSNEIKLILVGMMELLAHHM